MNTKPGTPNLGSRPQPRPRVQARTLWLLLLLLLVALALPAATNAQERSARLTLQAPPRVRVGEPVELIVSVYQARDVAGYEAIVLYDTGAAEFGGLRQHENDLKQLGRDIGSLAAPNLPQGTAIGLYSCPTGNCLDGPVDRDLPGGNGRIRLARVTIVPTSPGTLEIALGAVRLVDSAGQPLSVRLPEPVQVNVQPVEAGQLDGAFFAAPAAPWDLAPARTRRGGGPFDLTGDGRIAQADIAELALQWQAARLAGACAPLADPLAVLEAETTAGPGTRFDVNHDGCVDVADIQMVAARLDDSSTAPPAVREAPAAPLAAERTFVVNATADGADAAPGDGQCSTAYGWCTLRAAIMEANALPGPDTITFNIWGSGVKTITLKWTLPTINDNSGPLTIDGYTQTGAAPNTSSYGSNAQITVEVVGNGESVYDGFVITSPGNVIRGLAVYKMRRAFWIYGPGAHDNQLLGNFVGTNAAGSYGACCLVTAAHGIHVEQQAARTIIGSRALADRNVISGNAQSGLGIWHYGSDNNQIVNNIFGLNPAGNGRLANRRHGIDLNYGSAGNVVGGSAGGERNVSSGNDYSGIEISHLQETRNNQVIGNFFGTDPTGEQAPSWSYNGYTGITVEDGASNNLIGGNVVANSRQGGIQLTGTNTVDNQITDNKVGVSPGGAALGNDLFGVRLDATHTTLGPGNVIAYNQYNGVVLRFQASDYNTITRNSIYGNGFMGIELEPTGVTLNDPGDGDSGPNDNLNFPVITNAQAGAVSGTACALCTVELFVADGQAGAYGQGQTFVGATTADGSGAFTVTPSSLAEGDTVTATATDAAGNTSEFSQNVLVGTGGPPPPPADTYVEDLFNRTISGGWGSANIGGPYTLLWGSAAAQSFSVDGTRGRVTFPSGGYGREAILEQVSAQDVDITFVVSTDKASDGAGQDLLAIARRIDQGTMYRGRVRLASGNVYLQFNRGLNNSWSTISALVLVPGLSHQPGGDIHVRMQVVGTNPTTLRIKAWAAGQAEPAGWTISTSDSSALLQAPGAVGLRTFLPGNTSSAPLVFSFDDYRVTAP